MYGFLGLHLGTTKNTKRYNMVIKRLIRATVLEFWLRIAVRWDKAGFSEMNTSPQSIPLGYIYIPNLWSSKGNGLKFNYFSNVYVWVEP